MSPQQSPAAAAGLAQGEPRHASRAAAAPPLRDLQALERACLGQGLPPASRMALRAASRLHDEPQAAERSLRQALALAPDHPATHIALYRFHFYGNRLAEALAVGLGCLDCAARLNGLAADWRAVRRTDAAFDGWNLLPRFYLFTLKACAYVSLRLGRDEQGLAMLVKLQELDHADQLGAARLQSVFQRRGRDEDDD